MHAARPCPRRGEPLPPDPRAESSAIVLDALSSERLPGIYWKKRATRSFPIFGGEHFRYTITRPNIRRLRLRPGELNRSLREAPHETQNHMDTFHDELRHGQFPGPGKTAAEGEAACRSRDCRQRHISAHLSNFAGAKGAKEPTPVH